MNSFSNNTIGTPCREWPTHAREYNISVSLSLSLLTFDVEVLRVALAVALGVGGDACVEPGLVPSHVLQHERPVPDQDAARHILHHELSLRGEGRKNGC